eukprot:3735662-Amphidinium_carterae.1
MNKKSAQLATQATAYQQVVAFSAVLGKFGVEKSSLILPWYSIKAWAGVIFWGRTERKADVAPKSGATLPTSSSSHSLQSNAPVSSWKLDVLHTSQADLPGYMDTSTSPQRCPTTNRSHPALSVFSNYMGK